MLFRSGTGSSAPTTSTAPSMMAAPDSIVAISVSWPGASTNDTVRRCSLSQGRLHEGEEIEIRPGREIEAGGSSEYHPVETTVRSLQAGDDFVDEVTPGGLLGVGTGLDPSLTKGDALAGQVAGPPGSLPPTREAFTMDVELFDRIVGEGDVEPISTGEPLMLTVGTATTVGAVTSARDGECEVNLKRPVCAESDAKIAINRRVGARWRLIGVGTLE